MSIGYLKMHEQVLSRACFCEVVANTKKDSKSIEFYKVGDLKAFLVVNYLTDYNRWTVAYNNDILFKEYLYLSDLVRDVCIAEFTENIQSKYPYSGTNA